jgi:hypothetical protein
MVNALRLLDEQRERINGILNTVFGKNKLPPRTAKQSKKTTA